MTWKSKFCTLLAYDRTFSRHEIDPRGKTMFFQPLLNINGGISMITNLHMALIFSKKSKFADRRIHKPQLSPNIEN